MATEPASKTQDSVTTLSKAVKVVSINVLVLTALLALLEGGASLLFVGKEILDTPGVPEQHHVAHDETLGWVNRPNVRLPNMYGPGVGLHTNAQGFRNGRDFTRAVPAGKTRIICSGDSFTLGFGVADGQTWCQRLVALDPRLETVNMGQGGYGVDQAYLWYMRDGVALEHHLQLFAFLTDDFDRMRSDRFMGYGRPFLTVGTDSLAITNYPVPRTSSLSHWRALHGETVAKLNVVRLSRRLLGLDRRSTDPGQAERETQRLRQIASRIFAELQRANEANHSRLVLVYLPGEWDYKGTEETTGWRRFVRDEAARRNIAFLDLVEEIQRVPPTQVDRLYAPNAHFSVAGNEWAAAVLHERLTPMLDSLGASAAASTAGPSGMR